MGWAWIMCSHWNQEVRLALPGPHSQVQIPDITQRKRNGPWKGQNNRCFSVSVPPSTLQGGTYSNSPSGRWKLGKAK